MIQILSEGHTERAHCSQCRGLVSITFKYRPYLTEDGDSIPDVLQGFCDRCNNRILMPPQSIPKIQPYYAKQIKVQEYKVPNAIEDALLNIGSRSRLEKPDAFKTILRFYLSNSHGQSWIRGTDVKQLGASKVRLSFRIDEPTDSLLTETAQKLSLSKNQFVSMMIWDAKDRLTGNSKESKAYSNEIRLLQTPEFSA